MCFSVASNQQRRLLHVSYGEVVGIEEARCCFERIQTLLTEHEPGFRLVEDFTDLDSMDASCSLYITKIMDLCTEQQVSMVVRIFPDPSKDIGFNILSHFHYTRDVLIVTCNNLDEAEIALAGR